MNRVKNFLTTTYRMHQSLGVSVLYLFFLKIYWYLFAGQTRTKLLRLKFKGTPFTFYADNRLDLGTLEDIFVKQDYSFNYIGNPKIILDIGANIGDTAIFYSILFPGAQIFAIEPNPSVHERLGLNTAQFPNIKICKCAVADTTGKIDLFVGGSHLGSSIKAREQNTQSISVDVFSLEDFCKMQNLSKVDILKFDIEGAEENLLKSSFIKTNVVQMVGEMHDDLVAEPLEPKLKSLELKNISVKTLNSKRYIVYGTL